jgi:plasmid stability protein
MAAITIRDLSNETKERLRVQAAEHGRSMEAEARALIDAGTAKPARAKNFGVAFLELGKEFGGIELELPSREDPFKRPTVFSDEWESERAAYNAEVAKKRAAKTAREDT